MKRRLLFFVISVISLIVAKQLLIYNMLNSQSKEGTIINYAGRQRMLSQNIAKHVLNITAKEGEGRATYEERRSLRKLQKDWNKVHEGLKTRNVELGFAGKNSDKIQELFEELEKPYSIIDDNIKRLLKVTNLSDLSLFTNSIINYESSYLHKMDEIVFQYNEEYNMKLNNISNVIFFLTLLTIVVFLVEFFFILKPIFSDLDN